MAKVLLNAGADIDFEHPFQGHVLHVAAESGDVEIAELLLKAGAVVNVLDAGDQTPLDLALHVSRNYEKALNFLKKHGAKRAQDLKGHASKAGWAWHAYVDHQFGNLDFANTFLVDNRTEGINAFDENEETPLDHALILYRKQQNMISLLKKYEQKKKQTDVDKKGRRDIANPEQKR